MAIKINFTKDVVYTSHDGDVITKAKVYPDAYCKIGHYSGVKNHAYYEVLIYTNALKEKVIQRVSFRFTPSVAEGAENIVRQAYNHLKIHPQFASGEDC